MPTFKMSLIDNDYTVTCRTLLHLGDKGNAELTKFLEEIQEELCIGQTAVLEFEGGKGKSIAFSVSQAE